MKSVRSLSTKSGSLWTLVNQNIRAQPPPDDQMGALFCSAALATNTPGTAHAPDAFLGDADIHFSEFTPIGRGARRRGAIEKSVERLNCLKQMV